MTGIQNFFSALMGSAMASVTDIYTKLSEEQKKELYKNTAKSMLNKALQGKRAYEEDEIEFIKEELKIEL